MKDFYYILGVKANCTSAEIEDAYHKLSQKLRPDLNQHDQYFTNHFNEVQEAYDALIDITKRSKYDTDLHKFKLYSSDTKAKQQRVYPKTKGVNIAFTVALIVITFIFGAYVIRSINGSKAVKMSNAVPVIAVVTSDKVKHHKKKHRFIARVKTESKINVPKVEAYMSKISVDTPKVIKATPVKTLAPIIIKQVTRTEDHSYIADLNANETGVINMRETDNYSSDVIKVIPDHSKVFVLAKGDRYYKVMFNDLVGYVPKWTIKN